MTYLPAGRRRGIAAGFRFLSHLSSPHQTESGTRTAADPIARPVSRPLPRRRVCSGSSFAYTRCQDVFLGLCPTTPRERAVAPGLRYSSARPTPAPLPGVAEGPQRASRPLSSCVRTGFRRLAVAIEGLPADLQQSTRHYVIVCHGLFHKPV